MGFLSPNNLVYGLSLALLVLIYLRSRSRPTIEVSSLMLFDEAPAPVANVRHVRLDPLFWLEMAVLAALTLAVGVVVSLHVRRLLAPLARARWRSRDCTSGRCPRRVPAEFMRWYSISVRA